MSLKSSNTEVKIDMYRSNDTMQLDDHSVFIWQFIKIGELSENVKVLQYFFRDVTVENEEGPTGANGL